MSGGGERSAQTEAPPFGGAAGLGLRELGSEVFDKDPMIAQVGYVTSVGFHRLPTAEGLEMLEGVVDGCAVLTVNVPDGVFLTHGRCYGNGRFYWMRARHSKARSNP